jgi:hypothetical protein
MKLSGDLNWAEAFAIIGVAWAVTGAIWGYWAICFSEKREPK